MIDELNRNEWWMLSMAGIFFKSVTDRVMLMNEMNIMKCSKVQTNTNEDDSKK